ncbi:cupin domain-containing protein [Paenibacillus chitinolyticus]|uniref:cupin domain-containing protein n=1 Tax=Paenibacillus chitinolyticus TaxID=79263 RepID=UPI002DB61405|nr:cupin domain-containing protein [Paenibacillus chitinolyticus]MEC0245350.1 cupin domain-containing protein [Paenibacillus chitinolyticus]
MNKKKEELILSNTIPWTDSSMQGSRIKSLWLDETEVFVAMMESGTAIPLHDHPGREFTYILEGEMMVDDTLLTAGDFLTAGPGEIHRINIVKPTTCFIITEKSIEFIQEN